MSKTTVGVAATVGALILIFGTLAAMNWSQLQYGLKLPGRVGSAADQYFYDGQITEDGFSYETVTLEDGSVWKLVGASAKKEDSIPSWLIYIAQGPEQTLVLEERYHSTKVQLLPKAIKAMKQRPKDPQQARAMAANFSSEEIPNLYNLYLAPDSDAFSAALLELGFRKTTRDP